MTRVASAAGSDQRLRELDCDRVEIGVRLVKEQQLRLVQHGPGDGHALDHCRRESVRSGSSAR